MGRQNLKAFGITCIIMMGLHACAASNQEQLTNDPSMAGTSHNQNKVLAEDSALTLPPPPSPASDDETKAVETGATASPFKEVRPARQLSKRGAYDAPPPSRPKYYAYIMPASAQSVMWVFTEELFLYAAPNQVAKKLGKLRWGQKVAIVRQQDGWVEIAAGVWTKREHLTDRKARWHAQQSQQSPEHRSVPGAGAGQAAEHPAH